MTKQVEMISSFPNVEPGDSSVNIAVVGCGYVGLVAAVCFAEMGHKVICVDNDSGKIAALQSGQIPIHEEHLEELLRRQKKEALTFSTSLADAVRASEAVFIAVGTPPMENGDADLSYVEAVAVEIARSIDGYRVIVEKSTVPVYTSDWISRVLHRHGVARDEADVVSNPEFLREGTAVQDFLHPDRIVVGTGSDRAFRVLSRIYRPLTDGSYYRKEGCLTGPCSDLDAAPASAHERQERRADQACIQCVPGDEDQLHQFRRQRVRGGGRRHRGSGARHGTRSPHRSAIPESRSGLRRFVLSEGPQGVLCHQPAGGRDLRPAERSGAGERAPAETVPQQSALDAVESAPQETRGAGTGIQGRHRRHSGIACHQPGAQLSGGGLQHCGVRSGSH